MEGQRVKSLSALGFLTVIESPTHGLFGGYLVLNPVGRPLEFHCTAPVKASRAQEILYGPTLEPYLYAEQIGRTLVEKAKRKPSLLLTDLRPVLDVETYVKIPAALVVLEAADLEITGRPDGFPEHAMPESRYRVDGGHVEPRGMVTVRLAGQRLLMSADGSHVASMLNNELEEAGRQIDFSEPFGRIQEAIREAQRIHTGP
ncbi:MAG: hypothetical protein ACC645_02510 [Pirellulales bacterium]